jgi:hypothetical protein
LAIKRELSMCALKTLALSASLVLHTAAVGAAELSPWMGSADQIPFQLDPVTMVAVTFAAADPLQTGSTGACPPRGCTVQPKPAMASEAAIRAPQN